MGRALWLPDAIRSYGVPVELLAGWEGRGSDVFNPQVVVCHHTANPGGGDMPSLKMLRDGRSGLPGPLCEIGLSRSGIAYIVASGRANHAGKGSWRGVSGNTNSLGIEAENNGVGEGWSAAQLTSYTRICAAILDHLRRGPEWVCGHKEWAPGRKIDPAGIDMNIFRQWVAQERAAHAGQPTPQPPPPPPPGGHAHDTPIVKFSTGGPVDGGRVHGAVRRPNGTWVWQTNYSQVFWEIADIQRHIHDKWNRDCSVDGVGGPRTRQFVMDIQNTAHLLADGVVGPNTWRVLHG